MNTWCRSEHRSSVMHARQVTTYHISTMTMGERSALASKWLEEAGDAAAA